MLDVAGSRGVVGLTGFMDVTIGPYKSMTLVFTRHSGTPVEDLDSDGAACAMLKHFLEDVHRSGWHSHDVYSRNVLKNELGNYSLIDFVSAWLASEYLGSEHCLDLQSDSPGMPLTDSRSPT